MLTQSAFRTHESAQNPLTQKPVPARKLQQSALRTQLRLTAAQVVQWLGAEHAEAPLTRGAQQPLTHSESRRQLSAQRPLTQLPVPESQVQQSPFEPHTPPTLTHAAALEGTHAVPCETKPWLQSHLAAPVLVTRQRPWFEQSTVRQAS